MTLADDHPLKKLEQALEQGDLDRQSESDPFDWQSILDTFVAAQPVTCGECALFDPRTDDPTPRGHCLKGVKTLDPYPLDVAADFSCSLGRRA
jgi:hypothetical protein